MKILVDEISDDPSGMVATQTRQPVVDYSPSSVDQDAQDLTPPELHTNQNDNTEQMIANLANKIKLTDKELN